MCDTAIERTTGLDRCQEALTGSPQVNTVATHQSATLHKDPIADKQTYRRHEDSTKRQEGAGVRREERWEEREEVGEGG